MNDQAQRPSEQFVEGCDGTKIYVRCRPSDDAPAAGSRADAESSESGSAAPVGSRAVTILADGIACDGFIWKYLWDELGTRTDVAHFHYRGHGRSQSPKDAQRIGIEDHAEDLFAVRKALGDRPVILIGHSMGCQVVLEHLRRHPENVKAVVLMCGAPGRVTHTFKGTDALAQFLPKMIALVEKNPTLAKALWGSVPPELAVKVAFKLGEVDASRMNPEDLLPYLQHMVAIDLLMYLKMLERAGDHSAFEFLPHVSVPALVVGSDRDSFTPPRLSEQMASEIPGCELLMLSGTHALPLEQREAIRERLFGFYDRVLTPA